MDPWPVQALQASLDVSPELMSVPDARATQELPPLWHWLYFLRTARRSEMGVDGHPADRQLLGSGPPLRRMFASARVEFERPLRLSLPAQMTHSILHTRETQGSSGPLRFVTFAYEYFQDGACCVREQRDIVYLRADAATPSAVTSAAISAKATVATVADPAAWRKVVTPDPILLLRFSALTFNAHRIHYDQQYAQQQEGHRERVVHGPLVAILLAELLREHGVRACRRFELRARRPLFVNEPIELRGQPQDDRTLLHAMDPTGAIAMDATAWH